MSDVGLYLTRATEYCAETRNLIEDVIRSVAEQNDFLSVEAKQAILRDALQSMGFSEEQLAAFAKGELPTEYQVVPVEVTVKQLYRLYVRVPCGATVNDVAKVVKERVLNGEISDADLSPEWDIEEDDIVETVVDWDGAQYE